MVACRRISEAFKLFPRSVLATLLLPNVRIYPLHKVSLSKIPIDHHSVQLLRSKNRNMLNRCHAKVALKNVICQVVVTLVVVLGNACAMLGLRRDAALARLSTIILMFSAISMSKANEAILIVDRTICAVISTRLVCPLFTSTNAPHPFAARSPRPNAYNNLGLQP